LLATHHSFIHYGENTKQMAANHWWSVDHRLRAAALEKLGQIVRLVSQAT